MPELTGPVREPDDLPPGEGSDDAVVRRTKDGWRVGDADVPDLTSAMVLADLISAELAEPDPTAHVAAGEPAGTTATAGHAAETADTVLATAVAADGSGRSARAKTKAKAKSKDAVASETSKLRTTIGQLEHALTARIRVEQAIGVLAERHRIQPRQAFEQLRTAARNRGRRVIDIASDVVASASNPLLQLPDELSRPRSGARQGRRTRQTRGVLGSE
jgi:ANTAR domain